MGGITIGPVEDYLYSLLPPRDEVLAFIDKVYDRQHGGWGKIKGTSKNSAFGGLKDRSRV